MHSATLTFCCPWYVTEYENEAQEGEDFIDCDNLKEESRDREKVCRFKLDTLGEECTWQKDYGYDEGTPCVLLKLNKVSELAGCRY